MTNGALFIGLGSFCLGDTKSLKNLQLYVLQMSFSWLVLFLYSKKLTEIAHKWMHNELELRERYMNV